MLRSRLSALPRHGGLFGLCLVLSLAAAAGVRTTGAQVGDDDAFAPGDSAALAESLRLVDSVATHEADSIAVADSIAFEEEAAAQAGTFGQARSILDRSRAPGFLTYNTSYSVNRGNRTWTQSTDFYVAPGPVQVANTTSITIGREDRIGRLDRNRSTRTELAYRVAPWLRLGGALGLQRRSDESRNANFTGLSQQSDDISAQARFNQRYGAFPVSALLSYGYLDNTQSLQNSQGSTVGLFAGTSRDFGAGTHLKLDLSQQFSRLTSTVVDDADYRQDDRNSSRDVALSGAAAIASWITADGRFSTQRSRVERPARLPSDPLDPTSDEVVVPESIDGINDGADAALHLRLPGRALVNVSGSLGKNEQVYDAERERTSIASTESFRADFSKPILGMTPMLTYDNTISRNDLTRRNPGWIEANLTRRLDFNAGRVLTPRLSTRITGSAVLTRRRYEDFRSTLVGVVAPSNQDNLRTRGSLSLNYKASASFDTGVTAGLEQNDVVNLARTSSINNARLRTYSVGWNWVARPGVSWTVTQNNTATAAQQYYAFTPDRDQLSFIYNLTTNIGTQVTPAVRLELGHTLRLQSRGSWRLQETGRRFGKSSEFNSLDLNLRTIYTATSWLTLEGQQRLSSSPNFTIIDGQPVRTTESRRTEFTGVARVNYPFSAASGLNADIRRTLATDRNRTFGDTPGDRFNDNDYWLVTMSLRKTFGAKP